MSLVRIRPENDNNKLTMTILFYIPAHLLLKQNRS